MGTETPIKDDKTSPYFTDEKIRQEIDDLLRKNAAAESNLGLDSTAREKINTRIYQAGLFQKIKKLDEEFFKRIVIPEDRQYYE